MLSIDQSNHYRKMLEQFVRALPEFPENRFHGRGIVICGGGKYFPCVWICIRMLRSFGCTLPIELWHRGPREMTAEMKALIEPYGVVCLDAFATAREFPVKRLDGWELKPYAIINSRFAEVLYIDADNAVVRNPEFLFDTDLYRQTGSLFWQDVPNHTLEQSYLKDFAWELLDLPFRDEAQFESGQLLIDKRRSWKPLQLTLHLNEHSDYYYTAFFGDKDTFHLSWRRVDQEYSLNPHPPQALDNNIVLIQFDLEGRRLFQHRCNAKWTLTEKNRRIRGFLFEEECLGFLQELRTRWSPRFEPSPFTPAEQSTFDEILSHNTFRVHLDEQDVGLCVFNSDRTLTLNDEQYGWEIEDDHEGNSVLIFTADAGRRLCFLRKTAEGSWAGRWRYGERSSVELYTGFSGLKRFDPVNPENPVILSNAPN